MTRCWTASTARARYGARLTRLRELARLQELSTDWCPPLRQPLERLYGIGRRGRSGPGRAASGSWSEHKCPGQASGERSSEVSFLSSPIVASS